MLVAPVKSGDGFSDWLREAVVTEDVDRETVVAVFRPTSLKRKSDLAMAATERRP